MTVTVNIRSCYICIPYLSIYSWTVEQIGIYDIHISSAEGQTLLKATQIWLFAFCVVLIQIIVILKKKGGIHIKSYHQIICRTQWWHHKLSLTVMIWNILRMLLTIWFQNFQEINFTWIQNKVSLVFLLAFWSYLMHNWHVHIIFGTSLCFGGLN
jgi:hypothetical protein